MASPSPTSAAAAVWVVGMAASAGGLEPLHQLAQCLPASERLSYVVAQRDPARRAGTVVESLAAGTALRVVELADGDVPTPATLAIVPPGMDAELAEGRFRLVGRTEANGARPSCDVLFQSLAQAQGDAAVAIVLPGAGCDVAPGLRDIRAAGGLVIALQAVATQADGAPQAAIPDADAVAGSSADVDLVLRPESVGPALLQWVSKAEMAPDAASLAGEEALYAQIAQLVRVRTTFKLDEYKAGTVQRRIARRQGLLNLASLGDYLAHLRASPDEAQQLVRDTFVSVTSFFRDADAWRSLERAVGALVRGASGGMLRCWVAGCATGEEAYGIAMVFEEALRAEQRSDLQYMVFASDLDDAALGVARNATYASRALAELPQQLRERYVEMDGESGRVRKELRARVVFARQNVIDDPPFSRLDLISCRNLLIYLNPPVQRRVLELFHYALRPGGQLFLGRSEALDGHADLFAPVDLPARLYQRLDGAARRSPSWRQPDGPAGAAMPVGAERRAEPQGETAARRMQAQLLQRYAPPSLLLDPADAVLRFEGALKPFLDFPNGGAELRLFDMVDPSIRAELRALVYRCRRDRAPLQGAVHLRSVDGVPHEVRVHLEPLANDASGLLLVSFVARPHVAPLAAAAPVEPREVAIVAELERELADTREHLVIVVDELQSTNEQLQSANEEWQSANEELQSTNEELRTVNEELQSANEELLTVNEELQIKTAELEASASMLTNVKQSLDFPLLVVDGQRRVLDTNRAFRQLVRNDVSLEGMLLQGLAWPFPIGPLDDDLHDIFHGRERIVRELPADGGRRFVLHLMPYRLARQQIAGAVLLFEDVTALRGAEAGRLESEDRYRQVTESLPQLVWTCAADGPCDYLSPQWVNYTGVPEADQLGFGWLEQLHPDDRQRTVQHWMNTARQGLDFEIEFRIRRHDGAYRWFHTLARPLRDGRGAIVKWYGTNTDVDDRKTAEAALRVAAETLEQRVTVRTAELERASAELARAVRELEDLYHNAPCGYHSIDAQGRILRINDTELRWLGYTRDELIGRPITELLTAAGRKTFAAVYPRIVAGQSLSNVEVELLRKDGTELPMVVSATPVCDADGRFLHTRSVLLDHTVPRSQQRTLRSILTAAPMAVRVARRADHRVVFVNQAYLDLVQRSAEDALELDARQFYVDPAAFDAIAQRLGAGESVRNELVELQRPEDPSDRRWALASFMPIDYEGVPATLAWLFDVTELQQAKRLAEEASQTKSRFLANMSHEIRTPMNGVIGMIDLARQAISDPVQSGRLDKALMSARQLLAILNDILDLSKVEAGHMRLHLAPIRLAHCLQATRELYEESARRKGLALDVQFPAGLADRPVMADALRIRQVLDNLVANAIKFSSRGDIRVVAQLEREDEADVLVRFEVRDQGIGIAPDDVARVFKMFEQVDSGATRTHEGTGLGLAISKGLVSMMGGEMGVHSVPGAGSTFWFAIRLAWAETAEEVPSAAVLRAEPVPALRRGAYRALVAEDNEVNQEVQRYALEELGLLVDVVADGQQAVEAATRRHYDLIFMDMQMPVMNGLDATRAIRAGGLCRSTPIVAMTANAFEEDRQRCLDAGMNDFLTKPMTFDDLPPLLHKWLVTAPRAGAGAGRTA